jgi:hypothetical protein
VRSSMLIFLAAVVVLAGGIYFGQSLDSFAYRGPDLAPFREEYEIRGTVTDAEPKMIDHGLKMLWVKLEELVKWEHPGLFAGDAEVKKGDPVVCKRTILYHHERGRTVSAGMGEYRMLICRKAE